jgi:hypothetical protein
MPNDKSMKIKTQKYSIDFTYQSTIKKKKRKRADYKHVPFMVQRQTIM